MHLENTMIQVQVAREVVERRRADTSILRLQRHHSTRAREVATDLCLCIDRTADLGTRASTCGNKPQRSILDISLGIDITVTVHDTASDKEAIILMSAELAERQNSILIICIYCNIRK